MSSTSSIPIPTPRNGSGKNSTRHPPTSLRHASSSSFSTASPASSYGSPFSPSSTSPGGSSSPYVMGKGKGKGKQRAEDDGDEGVRPLRQPRRESLLGTSLSRSEHTVVDLGHYGGAPRLVSCVKSSQGFDWNQELFLPSYADYESHDLERRQDPVEDIVLTDEEVAAMFPQ